MMTTQRAPPSVATGLRWLFIGMHETMTQRAPSPMSILLVYLKTLHKHQLLVDYKKTETIEQARFISIQGWISKRGMDIKDGEWK